MAITLATSLLIICSVFFTSILSGVLGMAGGMVLMGILVWFLPVQQAMVLHAIAQFFANGSRAFIHRKHIFTKTLPHCFAGLGLVLCVFTLIAALPDKITVFALLGVLPFAAFFMPKKVALDFTRPLHAFFAGTLVTALQLTGGVAGSSLDIFFQTRKLTRHETVATKAFTQSVSHVTKFAYFGFIVSASAASSIGALPLWLCIGVVPAAMFGSHLSKYILARLTDAHFYKATQAVLFTVGTVYLFRAISLWMQNGQGG